MKKIKGLFGICCILLTLPANIFSQSTGGTISGSVRNQAGEVIAKARVTATNRAVNQSRSVETDEEGNYRLFLLAVGSYEITVEADGFAKVVRNLTLRLNEDSRLDFELAVAGTAEEVQVIGSTAPLAETQNSVLGLVIENKQILELPLNGRNFLQLGSLVANVSSTATLTSSAEGGLLNGPFAVSGQRDRSLTFLVDGVDNNNALSNSLSAQVSLDAIQEFKMITNLGSAEHGFHSGGMLNIVTRSGSNEYHFTLFEFFRNNKLNSPNYFESLVEREASKFNNNQFGATGGGPIIKDRTFFLGSYEGQRLRVGQPQFSNVPTLDERNGLFFHPFLGTTVQLPVDPVTRNILDRYVPLPNESHELGNYLAVPTIRGGNDFFMAKVDHLLTGDDIINVRYFASDNDTLTPIISNVFLSTSVPPTIPGFGLDQKSRSHNLSVNHTHNFNIHTINDFRFGYNRVITDLVPEDRVNPTDLGFSGVDANIGLFDISVGGISRLGNSLIYPVIYNTNLFQFSDSLTFIKGRHALKAGGDIRYHRLFHSAGTPDAGSIGFFGFASGISPLADFILGVPTFGILQRYALASPLRQTHYAAYIQDDYQVNRRLVVNAGLRYELSTVIKDPMRRLTNFSFSRGFFTPGVDTDTELYEGDHNNFAPRLGFALMLNSSATTVLRGGYGIYYDAVPHNFVVALAPYNEGLRFAVSLGTGVPGEFGRLFEPERLFDGGPFTIVYDSHLRTPYAQHFNLTLQQEIGRNTLISAGYVGTKTAKLTRMRDINQAIFIPGTAPNGQPNSTFFNIHDRRPSQLFGLSDVPLDAVIQFESASSAVYHSFQATVTRRMSKGLSLLSSYTWSKSIDDATDPVGYTGDAGGPQNANDYRQERGLSSFDIRHRMTLGYTYEFPFGGNRWKEGWMLNGIMTLQSGQPFGIALGFDPSLTGTANARPNNVPGAFIVKGGQVTLNPDLPKDPFTGIPAALIPAAGEYGTLGRNTFIGPNYKNMDFSVAKTTRLGERGRLLARFEMFNVFNATNLALPIRNLLDPTFGRSFKTQDVAGGTPSLGGGGPRVIQLALKVIY